MTNANYFVGVNGVQVEELWSINEEGVFDDLRYSTQTQLFLYFFKLYFFYY